MKATAGKLNMDLAPGTVRRIVWVALTMLAIVAALWLQHAADRRLALANDAAVRSAWQTSQSPAAAVPLASVSTRFAIRPSGTSAGGSELIWQAGSAGELLASLRALDGTDARLAQVKVTRNGSAGFSVVAERSP
jgi:hypothetical protein